MQYRKEIDGLRALAVLPVILFHGGLGPFTGGYVGVDVFFVISGYLITSIIAAEMAAGTFTLKNFYERRARRILPALFLVLFVCVPLAAMWLLPAEFRRFSHSLVATVLMVSNFFFASEPAGYFDSFAELQPLLHTWSLAVEEHYYLLFPLFVMLTWKRGLRFLITCIAVLAVASLAAAHFLTPIHPSFSFYTLPTRGWEIAAGALVALLALQPRGWGTLPWIREAAAGLGMILIGYAIFAFDGSTPFPSLYTLVPVLGTVLLVAYATDRTLVGRMLGWKPLVGLGLISYSAYLWHQPLFAFARQRSLDEPSKGLMVSLAVLSLLLAYVSWRYVERPFRQKQRFTRKQVVKYASWAAVVVVEAGIAIIMFNGFPERLPTAAKAIMATVVTPQALNKDNCNLDGGDTALVGCVKGAKEGPARIALIGDSHALALTPELTEAMAAQDLRFVQITKNGCPVAVGFYRKGPGGDACNTFQHNYLQELVRGEVDIVIVAVRWPNYVWGNKEYDNGEGGVSVGVRDPVTVAGVDPYAPLAERSEAMLRAYETSVNRLLAMGKRVVLVYPIPEQGWNIPSVAARELWFGDKPSHPFAVRYESYQQRNADATRALTAVGEHPNLVRVYPASILCNTLVAGRCASQANGALYYADDNHLMGDGARMVVSEIMKAVAAAPAAKLASAN